MLNIPDWAMFDVNAITSSKKSGRDGLLSICRSTWLQLVKKGLVPPGTRIIGKKVVWSAAVVKDVAERMLAGEFADIDLWAEKKTS